MLIRGGKRDEQKESKDYKDMMKAIEEYKKEMKSNERK